jgi:hypothetical protein
MSALLPRCLVHVLFLCLRRGRRGELLKVGKPEHLFDLADLLASRRWYRRPDVQFAPDSPLEGAVTCELVSVSKFPVSRENTGNFIDSGAQWRVNEGQKVHQLSAL